MFRDDDSKAEDDTTFFNTGRKYRLTSASRADLVRAALRTDGTIYLRLARSNWCRDYRGYRCNAAIVRALGAHNVGALNRMSNQDLDAVWRSWLAEGFEPEIGKPVSALGVSWFTPEE